MDRSELGALLRAARGRLRPAEVGLPAGIRRRVAGLRREEVAQLAGVSVDYVVRLEQGRGSHPSTAVLSALARALRLDPDERDRLFHLAGSPPPLPGHIDSVVRPSVLRMLDRFTDLPSLVLDAKGTVLAWNDLAAALLGDWSALTLRERNLNWLRFMHAAGRAGRVAQSTDELAATQSMSVAALRAAAAKYPGDPELARLIADLRSGSPRFRELWAASTAGAWRSQTKTVDHPELGPIVLDCDTLLVPDSGQVLIVYSAPAGSAAAQALSLLRVIGTQELTSS